MARTIRACWRQQGNLSRDQPTLIRLPISPLARVETTIAHTRVARGRIRCHLWTDIIGRDAMSMRIAIAAAVGLSMVVGVSDARADWCRRVFLFPRPYVVVHDATGQRVDQVRNGDLVIYYGPFDSPYGWSYVSKLSGYRGRGPRGWLPGTILTWPPTVGCS